MEALVIVMNQEKYLNALLDLFSQRGIYGGTILDSEGMVSTLISRTRDSGFTNYRTMLNRGRPFNKTIFLVLDSWRLAIAKECVREVVGDLEQENAGVMFTLPVSSFEGLIR